MSDLVDVTYHTDRSGSVIGHVGPRKVAAVWGPAVDNGEWFVLVADWPEARRMPTKEEALALLPVRVESPTGGPDGRR